MNKLIIPLIIVLAAITRLIPHPPNFTPIITIGLFGGAYISNRSIAILIPLSAMFLSDLLLGFHATAYWVYGSLLLVTMMGMMLKNKVNLINCLIAALGGSFLFFIITNFGVFLIGYPYTVEGFISCFVLAIPFFKNTLISTVIYSSVIYYLYAQLLKKFVYLQKT